MADEDTEVKASADETPGLRPLRIGLDVGSTTVKAVVLGDSNSLQDALFTDYRRHHANVRRCVAELLSDILHEMSRMGEDEHPIRVVITGSGGLGLANQLGVEFAQEVIAETEAINTTNPEADVIIELGGEDAKITYLKPTPEQRMNGSCAGGDRCLHRSDGDAAQRGCARTGRACLAAQDHLSDCLQMRGVRQIRSSTTDQ
jgi:activator of 2-hydroxyglutaryl-CoA dehydratase